MQRQKWIYLKSLLSRRPSSATDNRLSPSTIDIAFVRSLKHLEKRTRECYSETFDKISSNAFLEMMILDGCFIIELFIRHRLMMEKNTGGDIVDNNDMLSTTPLAWDMILLENQLPLFVLEHLLSLNQLNQINNISQQEPSSFLIEELAFSFFQHHFSPTNTYYIDNHHQQRLEVRNHLLDLLRNRLLISHLSIGVKQQPKKSFIPCAAELNFAATRIKKAFDDNPFNVTFNNGVLEIPSLNIVEDLSNPLLPNLVAFEQCHSSRSATEFTSYVWLMLNIIKDADGVRLLCKRGIINQLSGREEELVLLFKNICSGVTFPTNFYFSELYDKLNEHFQKRETKQISNLTTYFLASPPAIISLINAVLVLILALVQTAFTVLPYITKHPS